MDEVSQVVELECKGSYYLLKGTKQTIAYMVNLIKAFSNWKHENYLKKDGACDWTKLQEISKGTPVILNFPKEMFEKNLTDNNGQPVSAFELYCQKDKLRFCELPDFNPDDDFTPIAVPMQDAGIHSAQVKRFMEKRIQEEEKKNQEYDEKISEAKDEVASAKNDEEKEQAEKKKEALEEAKSQNTEALTEDKALYEKDNVIEITDYLNQGKEVSFDKNPEEVLAQEDSCGIVKGYLPQDCIYPVRDEGKVPESNEAFYIQKTGMATYNTIQREYKKDEEGLIYSEYRITDPNDAGKIYFHTDKGFTKETWKAELDKMLDEAGINQEKKVLHIKSKEQLEKYIKAEDANFTRAPAIESLQENRGHEYSNKEAENLVESIKADNKQKDSYEKSLYSSVIVPTRDIITNEKNEIALETLDGVISNIEIASMGKDKSEIKIRTDEKYAMKLDDGMVKKISGNEVLSFITRNDAASRPLNIRQGMRR